MNTDKNLTSVLYKGEIIEWTGKAEPFRLLDGANKNSIQLRWIICAASAIGIVALYIYFAIQMSADIVIPIVLFFAFIPAMAAIRPSMDRIDILSKVDFAITDQRVITFKSSQVHAYMAFDDLDKARIIESGDGAGDIMLGSSALNTPEKRRRFVTIVPQKNTDEMGQQTVTGMIFYNIKEIDAVKSLLAAKGVAFE